MDFWGQFSEKIGELIHELSVLNVLSPEAKVGALDPKFALTNYLLWLTLAFLTTALFFAIASRRVKLVPEGIANLAEWGVEFVRNSVVIDTLGPSGARYFPFVGTLFFFILFCNLWGLVGVPVPIPVGEGYHDWRIFMGKPGTGTISITATWALIVFFVYHWEGIRKQGFLKFWGSFAPSGAPAGIKQMVWGLEFILNFMRPVTLAVRLFANMYAGHLVLGVFTIFAQLMGAAAIGILQGQVVGGLVSGLGFILVMALLVALYAFELFVAFIQAYVFSMLTVQYINLSIHSEH